VLFFVYPKLHLFCDLEFHLLETKGKTQCLKGFFEGRVFFAFRLRGKLEPFSCLLKVLFPGVRVCFELSMLLNKGFS